MLFNPRKPWAQWVAEERRPLLSSLLHAVAHPQRIKKLAAQVKQTDI